MEEWHKTLRAAEVHLSQVDPVLARLIASYGHCELETHTDYYRQLIRAIVGQQLSVKAAQTIYGRFLEMFGGTVPKPEEILRTDDEKIRSIGFSYNKIKYVKDLALAIEEDRLDLAHIATLPNEEVIKQLVAVKGIGEWSAHMFMIFSLGRTNILPTGDLGIRSAIKHIYGLKELPSPSEMLSISLQNRWNPYQSVVCWYLWKSLDNEPVVKNT